MADLTITLVDAGLTAASQSWLISTCDVYGRPRTAHTATQQVVAPLSGQTTAGTATASLTPTANWVEDDVYYKFETAGYSRIFSKGSGTENLVATTQPTPVADAPAALRTTDLADWSPAAPTTDDVPIWDGTTWVPGAQSTGAMSAADILTAIKTVDGAGSGLDADLLDGQSAAAFEAAGTAAALVDDLSGVTNAATARTNLGLGSLATASTITSSEITDGTIVDADLASITTSGVFVPSITAALDGSTAFAPGANAAEFTLLIIDRSVTINRIILQIGVSSGNIDVGIFDDDGTAGAPATKLASSGSTACPAAGGASVTIASTALSPGRYWLAAVADNGTATFRFRGAGTLFAGFSNFAYRKASFFPLTNVTTPANSPGGSVYALHAGVA